MSTFKLFSMAALALAMAACSSEDNEILQNTQQPGTMHFTATIAAPSGDAITRTAYTEDGTTINVKWEVGDKIALVHNGVVDEAEVKTVDDVTGKATIEANITGSPLDNDDVYLAYPANAVVSATPYETLPFTPNPTTFNKVKNQDGTLEFIQNNLDFRMGSGKLAVSGSDVSLKGSVSIPSLICIWKLTLQDNTSTPLNATQLKFINNTYTQAKATSAAKSEYYLCVVPSFIPDPSGTFSFEATVDGDTYTFLKTGLSLTAGKYYQSTVKMPKLTDLSSISGTEYTVQNGQVLTGTLASEVKISIADGATVMLDGININEYCSICDDGTSAGITCEGNATIILDGENVVTGLGCEYPGIYVPAGKTLTIMGSGKLTASSGVSSYGYMFGAGIGGGAADDNKNCGNIVITSGTIEAMGGDSDGGMGAGIGGSWGRCGNITISGGNVTAMGGDYSAGIGGGRGFEGADGTCGDITISGGTVKATGGRRDPGGAGAGIGSGYGQSCGNITISGGTVTAEGGIGGGSAGAGIGGGGNNKACGVITITSGVTSVTATKGGDGAQSIGKGSDGKDITVTIDGVENAITSSTFTNFNSSVSGNTWTLTHK